MKYGLKTSEGVAVFSPNQVAAMRLGIAGLLLTPISIPYLKNLTKENFKWLSVVGLVGSGIPAFLFTNSQKYLDSGHAGILNSLTPLFTVLTGVWFFKKVTEPRKVVGVLIGLGGAAALISLNGFEESTRWQYGLLIVLATFSYGLSVNTVQSHLQGIKSLQITATSLLIAGVPCMIYALVSGAPDVLFSHPHGGKSFAAILTLSIFGTAGANMLYFWLTQQTSAIVASSVTYLMPLVAVGWGVLDHEVLTIGHLICGIIILSAIRLITR